jgi:BirA family transcriptional regulator, biotin operon repressor / biotin---[acetyl-CoA-carboxylase] ligase
VASYICVYEPGVEVVVRGGSTNAALLASAAAGAPDRSVLVAEHQDAGRGRLGREWVSPPGTGVTVSVLLRPGDVSPDRYGWLPLLTGLAVRDAVRDLVPAQVCLKWPNDLLLGAAQRKAGGILAEAASGPDGTAVVLGIGLNVAGTPAELPAGATSLAAGRLGTVQIRGSEIVLGAPVMFTKSNIDKFDF